MRTVIVGCGRVGAMLAVMLDDGGHHVTILDISTAAFDRLPSSFKGEALRGDGTDEDTLRRAGAEDADLFLAVTEGDNRNIMAAQLAAEAFRVDQVIAKINDPLRALAYAELGIATICRTDLMANAILSYLKLPVSVVPGVRSGSGHHFGPWHMMMGNGRAWGDPTYSALQVLNERFARGEIAKQEYEDSKATLLSGR